MDLLWKESGKPPAQIDPFVRVVEDKMFVSVMRVFVSGLSSADHYAHVTTCPLIDHVCDVIFPVVKEDQR